VQGEIYMSRVSIVGSGNVGANTAFFIAEEGVSDVLLFDAREGISTGKALDLMEAAPIRTYRTKIAGTDSFEDIRGSEVIVLSAGHVRKPGMRREELFEENATIIRELAARIGTGTGSIVVMVTEPVDLLTALFVEESGMPRERVLGIGGLLDTTRLSYAVSRDLCISMENISALVIGPHTKDMIIPERYTNVSGVPILKLMPRDQFFSLKEETVHAGDFIIEMVKNSTAYYAPSSCIAELVRSVVLDADRMLPVSILLCGEYGIDGVAMSVPAVIGRRGVKNIYLPKLTADEERQLRKSAEQMRLTLQGGR